MKTPAEYMFLGGIVTVLGSIVLWLIWCFIYFAGREAEQKKWEEEAVKRGKGEYILSEGGKKEFKWKP